MWEVLNNKGFAGRFVTLKFIYSYADTPELPNVNSAGVTIFCYVSSYSLWQVFNGIIVDPNNNVYSFTCVNNDFIGTDDGLIIQI